MAAAPELVSIAGTERFTRPAPKIDPVPESVAILGLGPSVAAYMDLARRVGARARLADEVWTINALGDVFACDRVFHMDDVRIQQIRADARPRSNIANMLPWLRTTSIPVYTSWAHPDYPATYDFPLEDVVNDSGYGYFNSTAAYAVAYAIYLRVKQISVFGCDFTYPNAHDAERGRGCMEFWLGFAAARGIKLALPPSTSLMDAMEPPARRYYGYDALTMERVRSADGRIKFDFKPLRVLPTADEIEGRYDHSKHPNSMVQVDPEPEEHALRAHLALEGCLHLEGVHRVLDVGSGDGQHAAMFRADGKDVTTISMQEPADVIGDYTHKTFPEKFDLIWASHVLEHQRNAGAFLEKCRHDLKPGGWLAVTVPPMKDEIVGGHVGLFNAGLLLYHLILAGFDCSRAAVRTYGYNVSVIVQKSEAAILLPPLTFDHGDVAALAHLFPLAVQEGFDGCIEKLNWPWQEK